MDTPNLKNSVLVGSFVTAAVFLVPPMYNFAKEVFSFGNVITKAQASLTNHEVRIQALEGKTKSFDQFRIVWCIDRMSTDKDKLSPSVEKACNQWISE